MAHARILVGDLFARLPELPAESVCSVVCDPPYGIRFMGKAWDGDDIIKKTGDRAQYHGDEAKRAGVRGGHKSIAAEAGKYDLSPSANRQFQEWTRMWAAEALRVLKPGGYLLSFASTRTYHRMTCGIEDAGFEIRDQIGWVFGSGFPKSHNLHGDWEGWGTALKPAWEPICVARKPFKGTVEQNVLKHGTGALNIDACRIEGENVPLNRTEQWTGFGQMERPAYEQVVNTQGRWPANLIHDGSDEVVAAFPVAAGQCADAKVDPNELKTGRVYGAMKRGHEPSAERTYEDAGGTNFAMKPGQRRMDEGSAARFFYCAKASSEDRNEGCHHLDSKASGMVSNTSGQHITRRDGGAPGPSKNNHPTVKPTELMRYLCRLVTPPGGTVLDPFMGSGSTGKAALLESFDFIGVEISSEYAEISEARIRNSNPLINTVEVCA